MHLLVQKVRAKCQGSSDNSRRALNSGPHLTASLVGRSDGTYARLSFTGGPSRVRRRERFLARLKPFFSTRAHRLRSLILEPDESPPKKKTLDFGLASSHSCGDADSCFLSHFSPGTFSRRTQTRRALSSTPILSRPIQIRTGSASTRTGTRSQSCQPEYASRSSRSASLAERCGSPSNSMIVGLAALSRSTLTSTTGAYGFFV